MYTCIVIDDEPLARERITDYVEARPGWQVVAEAAEYQDAYRLILEHRPQLCFMDINIIGGSGVDLAFQLAPQVDTQWVFSTAYADFALKAFELNACDYLLKPFENHRLDKVLSKLEVSLLAKASPKSSVLAVKSIGLMQLVHPEDILWIKGAANYVELHCQERMLLHRETLNNLQMQLDPSRFVRVHRSAIVNIDKVTSLTSELGRYSLLQLCNGDEVKVSDSHRHQLFQTLGVEAHP